MAFRKPLRVIKWLGYDIVRDNPLIRMLHEARAHETAATPMPIESTKRYTIRRQRYYARGAEDTFVAPEPPPPHDANAPEAPLPIPEPVFAPGTPPPEKR